MSTTLGGMTPTGRRVAGPGCDIVELDSAEKGKHTALQFHAEFRDHPSIGNALGNVVTFYESRPHPAFADLVDIPEDGVFIFATGATWTVAELVRKLADQGRVGGIRAGLELMYLSAQALEEAQNKRRKHGLHAHGAISPWRLCVKNNGDVQMLGYGIPQAELLAFLDDERRKLREDSFRYCPPERMEKQPEDISTDLFSLSLVAFELMLGRPVYDGLVDDIRMQASRAEGGRRLHQVRDQLPEGVKELIGRAIKPDVDARWRTVNEFIYAAHDLLKSPDAEGPHLIELVAKMRGKSGAAVVGGHTGALSKEQLAALRDELDEEAKPLPPPKGPRPNTDAAEEASDEPQRWKRTAPRAAGAAPASSPPVASPVAAAAPTPPTGARPSGPPTSARPAGPGESPVRQIRRMGESGGLPRTEATAPPVAAAPAAAPERPLRRPEDGPRRMGDSPRQIRDPARAGGADVLLNRLRTSSGGQPSVEPAPAPVLPPAPPVAPPPAAVVAPPPAPRMEPPAPRVEPSRVEPTPAPSTPLASDLRSSGGAPLGGAEVTNRPESGRRDEMVYFQVSVDGGPAQRTRIRTAESLAEATHRLIQALSAPPCDLVGNTTGWFRVEQEGRMWKGSETVAVLDPEKVVKVVFVPNRVVLASFEIEGSGAPIRFQAPVGTAVMARSLVAHLQKWLRLSEASWTLVIGGERMGSMQILDEFSPQHGVDIAVRR